MQRVEFGVCLRLNLVFLLFRTLDLTPESPTLAPFFTISHSSLWAVFLLFTTAAYVLIIFSSVLYLLSFFDSQPSISGKNSQPNSTLLTVWQFRSFYFYHSYGFVYSCLHVVGGPSVITGYGNLIFTSSNEKQLFTLTLFFIYLSFFYLATFKSHIFLWFSQ